MNGDSIFVNPKLGIASEAKDPVIAILLAQFHHLDKTEFLSECIAENISSKECNISFVKALNLLFVVKTVWVMEVSSYCINC